MKVRTFLLAIALSAGSLSSAFAILPPVVVSPAEEMARRCTSCHGGEGRSIVSAVPNIGGQKKDYLIKQLKSYRPAGNKPPARIDPTMMVMTMPLADDDIEKLADFFSVQAIAPPEVDSLCIRCYRPIGEAPLPKPTVAAQLVTSAVASDGQGTGCNCPPVNPPPVTPSPVVTCSNTPGATVPAKSTQAPTIEDKARICKACHGEKGISIIPLWPNIAAQRATYIMKQLKAFRSDGKGTESPTRRRDPAMELMAKVLSDNDIKELAVYFSKMSPTPTAPAPTAPTSLPATTTVAKPAASTH